MEVCILKPNNSSIMEIKTNLDKIICDNIDLVFSILGDRKIILEELVSLFNKVNIQDDIIQIVKEANCTEEAKNSMCAKFKIGPKTANYLFNLSLEELVDLNHEKVIRMLDDYYYLIEKLNNCNKDVDILSLESYKIDKILHDAKKISLDDLSDYSKELAGNWERISERLDKNSYFSTSMEFFVTNDKKMIAKSNKPEFFIDSIVVDENVVICKAGGLKNDGHLNEFINEINLMPLKEYHVDGAFIFRTDSIGRVIGTHENLTVAKYINRGGHSQLKTISNLKGGCKNDIGGHIIANNVNGPTEAINIVPMDSDLNNSGEWKSMELRIKEAVNSNKSVIVKKEISYIGDSMKPNQIRVELDINGENTYKTYKMY